MGLPIYRDITTVATGAIAASFAVPAGRERRLYDVRVVVDAAVVAVESATVTVNSADGATYDYVLDTQAMSTLTQNQYIPAGDLWFIGGDSIDVAFANTNNNTVTVTITMGEL